MDFGSEKVGAIFFSKVSWPSEWDPVKGPQQLLSLRLLRARGLPSSSSPSRTSLRTGRWVSIVYLFLESLHCMGFILLPINFPFLFLTFSKSQCFTPYAAVAFGSLSKMFLKIWKLRAMSNVVVLMLNFLFIRCWSGSSVRVTLRVHWGHSTRDHHSGRRTHQHQFCRGRLAAAGHHLRLQP